MIKQAAPLPDFSRHREFIEQFHSAYSRLKAMEEFQFLERLERDQLEDYKTHALGVGIGDPHYERRSTYLAGMAEGLRRWRLQKERYLTEYKQLMETKKEEEAQNDRTSIVPGLGWLRRRDRG